MYKTPKQVAKIFNVSERTVQQWCRDEIIEHLRLNRMIRFTDEHIERFVSQNIRSPKRDVGGLRTPNPDYTGAC